MFRGGVSLVRVDAQVLEGRRVLGGLSQEDFVVRDQGEPQEIVYFGRETEPLWVVLLLDVSGSMRKRVEQMASVSRQALALLRPSDQVAVLLFARNMGVHLGFTANLSSAAAAIASALRVQDLGSGTAINAAITQAAAWMRGPLEGKPGRRAIVVLTDNEGLNYQATDEKTIEALYDSDAVLNAIVPAGARPPELPRPGVALNPDFTPPDVFRLARETGGEVERADQAGVAFREMLDRIRTRYSIHYRAPETSGRARRRIAVDLSPAARRRRPRAEVLARAGYWTRPAP